MKLPKCEWCDKAFLPKTAWQRFCCDDHNQLYHMKRRIEQRKKARGKRA